MSVLIDHATRPLRPSPALRPSDPLGVRRGTTEGGPPMFPRCARVRSPLGDHDGRSHRFRRGLGRARGGGTMLVRQSDDCSGTGNVSRAERAVQSSVHRLRSGHHGHGHGLHPAGWRRGGPGTATVDSNWGSLCARHGGGPDGSVQDRVRLRLRHREERRSSASPTQSRNRPSLPPSLPPSPDRAAARDADGPDRDDHHSDRDVDHPARDADDPARDSQHPEWFPGSAMSSRSTGVGQLKFRKRQRRRSRPSERTFPGPEVSTSPH